MIKAWLLALWNYVFAYTRPWSACKKLGRSLREKGTSDLGK
jgi:hypothetical protein